jgi:hypothetical protein
MRRSLVLRALHKVRTCAPPAIAPAVNRAAGDSVDDSRSQGEEDEAGRVAGWVVTG